MARGEGEFILMLGAGNALGAIQGGVYEALAEAGRLPTRFAGVSIGAVNAAVLAGTPAPDRVAALRRLWDGLAVAAFDTPLSAEAPLFRAGAILWSRLIGRPGLYRPELGRAFYDLSPLKATLRRAVDFALIGSEAPLVIGATDLASGEEVLFDSRRERLTPEHVLASCALPPDFEAVAVDGRLLGDGALSAQAPVAALLDGALPDSPATCLLVDLFDAPERPPPTSLDEMIERRQDLIFANQTRSLLEWLAAAWPARAPAPLRLVHLLCGTLEGSGQKMFDFSATTLDWRWRRGLDLGRRALALLDDDAGNGPAFDLRVCS